MKGRLGPDLAEWKRPTTIVEHLLNASVAGEWLKVTRMHLQNNNAFENGLWMFHGKVENIKDTSRDAGELIRDFLFGKVLFKSGTIEAYNDRTVRAGRDVH